MRSVALPAGLYALLILAAVPIGAYAMLVAPWAAIFLGILALATVARTWPRIRFCLLSMGTSVLWLGDRRLAVVALAVEAIGLADGLRHWPARRQARKLEKLLTQLHPNDGPFDLKRARVAAGTISTSWKMPAGVTSTHLMGHHESLEQALGTNVRLWYEDGHHHIVMGSTKMPKTLNYWQFYRQSRPPARGTLWFGVGVSTWGPLWADLAELPHLMIAGASSMGKSVFLRQMLAHLLWEHGPERLQLWAIDLKLGMELNTFEGLPHLSGRPVLTNVSGMLAALQPLEQLMEERLELLARARAKNLTAYNGLHNVRPLPYYLLVVDEFGELRPEVAPAESEERRQRRQAMELLSRLCRLGRACGLHVVGATQRSDAETVPGDLKANLATAVLAYHVVNSDHSYVALGRGDASAATLPARPGAAVFKREAGNADRVVTPYISPESAVKTLRNKWGIGTHLTLERFEADDEEPSGARDPDYPLVG